MANEIKMPQLSDTMNSGKIIAWSKKEGDEIKRGDILAEVETEKANLEIESFQQGVLIKILVPADTSAKVGDVIAVIGARGEKYEASAAPAAVPVEAPKVVPVAAVQPAAPHAAAPQPSLAKPVPPPAPAAVPSASRPAAPLQAISRSFSDDRIKASPLARKMAQERNIDLSAVSGSGPEGRIVRKDIEYAQNAAPQMAASSPQLSVVHSAAQGGTTPAPQGSGKTYPLSKMRDLIARRMQESVTQSPHFYTTTSVEMSESKKLYSVLKERAEFKGVSLNHFIIKAAAYGLATEPRVNFAMREGQVFEPPGINIGIITAIEDGLLIPVVKDANSLAFKDLVFESRAAIERARAGRPSSADLSGGTFSISNMGMFDVENFTAIINPGQGAVLAVSSAIPQPVVRNGEIVVGLVMKATLSVDHRIIDGVMAATFLKAFKQALETPALLLL